MRNIFLSILLMFFVLSVPKAGTSQESAEDIDNMISNPGLVRAIDELARNNSREARLRVMTELNEANYLVPVLAKKLDKSKEGNNEVVKLGKNSDIEVLAMSDGKGNEYMPVFTDIKSVKNWASGKEFNTIAMPAAKVWTFVLGKPEYDGVVVNPGIKALPLKKPAIKTLQQQN